jgi:tRNA threonylcarbamoyladenosine biosynthesis protein TsaB
MTTLALDCSLKNITLALLQDGAVSGALTRQPDQPHSESLLALIDELLARDGVKIADLTDALYCHGPGGFTSLRVGLATLMGLVAGTPVRLRTASSLLFRCLSAARQGPDPVLVLMRAGQGRFFTGTWTGAGFREAILTREEVQVAAQRLGSPLILGDGAQAFEPGEFPAGCRFHPADLTDAAVFPTLARQAAVATGPVVLHYLQGPV